MSRSPVEENNNDGHDADVIDVVGMVHDAHDGELSLLQHTNAQQDDGRRRGLNGREFP